VVIDGAAYFRLAKVAMGAAERSILLLGWDFDPRIRLEPDRPDQLGAFLQRLLAERAGLRIHILIWDMAWPIAANRRFVPQRARSWLRADRLHYRLDSRHPLGGCHHQKLLVVDDAVAFCGGMDLAGERWDTPAHPDRDPRRRTPAGRPFQPRHDLMLAVDGAAAAALGDLARERWRRATGERIEPPAAGSRIWPDTVPAEFTDVPVAIARTAPAWRGQAAVRENEALFQAAIAAARSWIYLESQYVAAPAIAAALADRLAAADGPEVVIVCPERSPSYFDRLAMDPARAGFIRRLRAADRHGRFRILAPVAACGTPIVVHSKVMVVDDRLLRVGSANLNNRSLGFDTECDLAIEAAPGEPDAGRVRRAVVHVLARLVAEHLGRAPAEVQAILERTGSLVASIDALDRNTGRRLRPLAEPAVTMSAAAIGAMHLFDPLGVSDAWRPWRRLRSVPRP
jgi:phosphatidylserine/phosphatidylglycerophosphate/cardiolipin synthase-like enzyme